MLKKIRFSKNQNGQTTFFILAAILTITAFTWVAVNYGLTYREQIRLQRAADSAATSGALWQARTYNLIAGMNQGIKIFMTVFLIALVILVILVACSATVIGATVCGTLLAALEEPLTKIMRYAWDIAVALSKLERQVIQVTPPLVIAQSIAAARANEVKGAFPYPYLPESLGGDHDDKHTLTLHTKQGGFASMMNQLSESLPSSLQGPSQSTLAKKFYSEDEKSSEATDEEKNTTASSSTEQNEESSSSQSSQTSESPDPLDLDDDFRPRMKLGVLVWNGIPLNKKRNATAQATPFQPNTAYGEENLDEMNWHVKLVPVDFPKDIGETLGKLLPTRD